jgi:WD40 repeat protein
VLALTGHHSQVRAVAFSPDGRRALTGSYDGTARIWDTATDRELACWFSDQVPGLWRFAPGDPDEVVIVDRVLSRLRLSGM